MLSWRVPLRGPEMDAGPIIACPRTMQTPLHLEGLTGHLGAPRAQRAYAQLADRMQHGKDPSPACRSYFQKVRLWATLGIT